MKRRTWVLDTDTKGTGAEMVPLERAGARKPPRTLQVLESQERKPRSRRPPRPKPQSHSTPLPPGHVRKKSTGEIGKVRAVDPKAGTATVLWLRSGRTSTVALSAIARR